MKRSEAYSRYRPSVRIGNWFEDICLEEDEIKAFLRKRQKTELLIQKTRLLFLNFHAKVDLEKKCDHLRFGAVIQILSCMKVCPENSTLKSALSVVINEHVVRQSLQVNEMCELTVAPSVGPCVRNCFKIVSGDNKTRDGEPLKFGQNFALQCIDAEEQPLLLFSMQKSADLSTMVQPSFDSRNRGELNLPVALCLKKNIGSGKSIPSAYTMWRCYHSDPKMRFETDGEPIPPNCPVVITHFVTNRNLATENIIIQTLFGPEFLVSVQNYIDIFRKESSKNLWIISTGDADIAEELPENK